jgi:hypothetical protein
MPSNHALLSPSAASRWLVCPGSVRAAEKFRPQSSVFAEEGTCAHALGEYLLHCFRDAPYAKALPDEVAKSEFFNPEMNDYANDYASFVFGKYSEQKAICGPSTVLEIEQQVRMDDWAPECWGTADAIIASENSIHVIDLKYGKGISVSAFKNPQIMLYALGAYADYSLLFPGIRTVCMTIYQPRINNISEFTLSADELVSWGDSIRGKARQAYLGEKVFSAGSHCRFCPIKATCRTRAENIMTVVDENMGRELSWEEIAKLLPQLTDIKSWAADLWGGAEAHLLDGMTIPGYKLVAGRGSTILDDENIIKTLEKEGIKQEKYLSAPKLFGITELKKNIGSKKIESLCGEFIEKVPGPPKMAPESDKRESIHVTGVDAVVDDLLKK